MASKLRTRFIVLCLALVLLFSFGCAGLQSGGNYNELEQRVDDMELIIASLTAASFRPHTLITGGGTGSIDKIDGDSLSDGDTAVGVLEDHATYGNTLIVYVLDATSSCGGDDTATPPKFFQPDTNAGTKCWELAGFYASQSVAPMKVVPHSSGNDTLTADEVMNTLLYITVATELELPAIGTASAEVQIGSSFCAFTVGAIAISLDPTGDSITLGGVEDTDGDKITNTSTAGDFICLVAAVADGWVAPTNPNTWTAGGA